MKASKRTLLADGTIDLPVMDSVVYRPTEQMAFPGPIDTQGWRAEFTLGNIVRALVRFPFLMLWVIGFIGVGIMIAGWKGTKKISQLLGQMFRVEYVATAALLILATGLWVGVTHTVGWQLVAVIAALLMVAFMAYPHIRNRTNPFEEFL